MASTKIPFESGDWDGTTLTINLSEEVSEYASYEDDVAPIIQVYKRTGSEGNYIETLQSPTIAVQNRHVAASLKGGYNPFVLATWNAIADGSFQIKHVAGAEEALHDITALNFGGASDEDAVAAIITAKFTDIICTAETGAGGSVRFVLTSLTTGRQTILGFLLEGSAGTDISSEGLLAGRRRETSDRIIGTWNKVEVVVTDSSAYDGLMVVM